MESPDKNTRRDSMKRIIFCVSFLFMLLVGIVNAASQEYFKGKRHQAFDRDLNRWGHGRLGSLFGSASQQKYSRKS
jgi:hypothetical protein